LEEKYIKNFNTLVPNGYNISPTGGRGSKRMVQTFRGNKGKAKIKPKRRSYTSQ